MAYLASVSDLEKTRSSIEHCGLRQLGLNGRNLDVHTNRGLRHGRGYVLKMGKSFPRARPREEVIGDLRCRLLCRCLELEVPMHATPDVGLWILACHVYMYIHDSYFSPPSTSPSTRQQQETGQMVRYEVFEFRLRTLHMASQIDSKCEPQRPSAAGLSIHQSRISTRSIVFVTH